MRPGAALFGTHRKTQILELLALLEESHALELSRLLGAQPKTVQRIVDAFEEQGIIEGRIVGRERRLTFNRRFPAIESLVALLNELGTRDSEITAAASSLRRRPRRKGKEI